MEELINYKGSVVDFTGESCKTMLLDADSIIYIVGWQQKESFDEEETKSIVDQFITDILITVGCNQYAGFFSDKVTFRHEAYPEYKGKRPPVNEDIARWKPIIVQHCVDKWKFEITENSEADDAVALLQKNMENTIICSPDKDLKMIVGKHYDYKKGVFTEIDEDTSKYNRAVQMLTGDAVDNIKGLRGVGEKGAQKLLKDIKVEDYEDFVKQKYLEKSTLEDFELHNLLIGMGEYEDYTKYIWALQTFKVEDAEPSDYLKQLINY